MTLSQQTLSVLQCSTLFSQTVLLNKSPTISLCMYTNIKTMVQRKNLKSQPFCEKRLYAEKDYLV